MPQPGLHCQASGRQSRVVTGASSGIGEAAVSLFAREGATVIAAARHMDRYRRADVRIARARLEGFRDVM
ncbi:SDR family NAD(P)-dependent oxidoreductase [Sphingomonas bacterium]|uniref:SDR family NAD(P)-dependent oxidoreductase n=1 Tax=Sphingomonas bacterium TaxID=1895847 RepID=UPI001577195F